MESRLQVIFENILMNTRNSHFKVIVINKIKMEYIYFDPLIGTMIDKELIPHIDKNLNALIKPATLQNNGWACGYFCMVVISFVFQINCINTFSRLQ